LKYVQNIEIKRLTSKNLPMYFSSMTPLFLFLTSECFKTWNYIADSSTYVCLGFQAISMSTVTAISQTLVHITVAEHQYPSKVLIQNSISRALFERNSIKWFQLSII